MKAKGPLLCLCALVILLLAFYCPWLFGKAAFYFEDASNAVEPFCSFIGRSFARFHLPLWNPYHYCGMPETTVIAPGIFYPFNLLYGLLPFSSALAAIMIVSQVTCAVGGFLFVRSLGWGVLPAYLCAAILGLSGYMFCVTNNYTLAAGASWLPLALFCVRKAVLADHGQAVKWGLAVAGCLAMLLVSGRPEISTLGIVLLASYGICLLPLIPKTVLTSRLVLLAKCGFIAVLFAMPVTLPCMEWFPMSRRSEGMTPGEVLMFSANWYDLLAMYASYPLGDLQANAQHFRMLVVPKDFPPYVSSAFLGSVAIVLAILGLQNKGKYVYWGAIVALLLSILCSLGGNTAIIAFLVEHISSLSILRFPSKLLFFAVLCISLLAARGLRNYLSGSITLVPGAVVAAVVAAGSLMLLGAPGQVLPFVFPMQLPPPFITAAQRAIATSLLVSTAEALIVLVVMYLLAKSDKKELAGKVVVTATSAALVANAFMYCSNKAPADFYTRPSYVADRFKSLCKDAGSGNDCRTIFLAMEHLSIPPSFTPTDAVQRSVAHYQYGRQLLKPFANADFNILAPQAIDGSVGVSGEYFNFMTNSYLKSTQAVSDGRTTSGAGNDIALYRALQMTATGFVTTQIYRFMHVASSNSPHPIPVAVRLLNPDYFELVEENPQLNVRMYRLKQRVPRAYLSYGWTVMDSRDSLLQAMYDADSSSFNPAVKTLLAKDELPADSPLMQEQEKSSPDTVAMTPVKFTEECPERITMTVQNDRPALLVLADQHYPGWKATVDGQPQPILRCNGFFRAVALAPGAHTIEFSFQPFSLAAGCALMLLSLLWASALWFSRTPKNS